ncbi:homoserine O-acetyltransferase [Gemmatimonadetes bacterium T265]|nr:homoserine O-acetyltransferase [Gemmatimonadetes bacterium T265]
MSHRVLLAALFALGAARAGAQTNPGAVSAPPGPRAAAALQGDAVLPDFRFDSGGMLPALRLHYRTLGRPRRDAAGVVRNAVLILHGTGGAGTQFLGANFAGELFGPGQPLDTARYYVVLPDGIGHGQSSKPSDGLHARFPHYTYGDMVRAERRLLEEGLGVRHLRLVLGTSMGCMHAWVWGTTRPGYADALAPFACLPTQIAGRNRMFRRMAMDDIRLDPAWQHGEYRAQPPGLTAALQVLFVMGSAPLVQQAQAPTQRAADSVITAFLAARRVATDANDFLYQFDASRDYDPSALLDRVRVPVLAINSADDEINPPDLGIMERLIPRVPTARYVLIPAGPTTRGHGTHTQAAVWKAELARFLDALPPAEITPP